MITLCLSGRTDRFIARRTGLPLPEVARIRDASPSWREHLQTRQDARIEREEAERRRKLSDIARAQRLSLLASKRGPDGRIDWPSVPGWVDFREQARLAVEEEYARPAP